MIQPPSRGVCNTGMVSAFDEAQALGRTVQNSESTFPSREGWIHNKIAITRIPELVLEYVYINNYLKNSLKPSLPFLQLYSIGSYVYAPPSAKHFLSYDSDWVLSSSLDEAINWGIENAQKIYPAGEGWNHHFVGHATLDSQELDRYYKGRQDKRVVIAKENFEARLNELLKNEEVQAALSKYNAAKAAIERAKDFKNKVRDRASTKSLEKSIRSKIKRAKDSENKVRNRNSILKKGLSLMMICGTLLGSTVLLLEPGRQFFKETNRTINRLVYQEKKSILHRYSDSTNQEKLAALSFFLKKEYSSDVILYAARVKRSDSYKTFTEREKKQLTKIWQKAEDIRRERIVQHYLPVLENHLKNRQFGRLRRSDYNLSRKDFLKDFEETDNAIDTTIAMLSSHSAYPFKNTSLSPLLDEKEELEINAIPCEGIVEIEKLWRKYTDNRCGWFGIDSAHDNLQCTELTQVTLEPALNYRENSSYGKVPFQHGGALFSLVFPGEQDLNLKIKVKVSQCLTEKTPLFADKDSSKVRKESLYSSTNLEEYKTKDSELHDKLDKLFHNNSIWPDYSMVPESENIKRSWVGIHYEIDRNPKDKNSIKITYRWNNKVLMENSVWKEDVTKSDRDRFYQFLEKYQIIREKVNETIPKKYQDKIDNLLSVFGKRKGDPKSFQLSPYLLISGGSILDTRTNKFLAVNNFLPKNNKLPLDLTERLDAIPNYDAKSLYHRLDNLFLNNTQVREEAKGIKQYTGKEYSISRFIEREQMRSGSFSTTKFEVKSLSNNKLLLVLKSYKSVTRSSFSISKGAKADKSDVDRFLKFLDEIEQNLTRKSQEVPNEGRNDSNHKDDLLKAAWGKYYSLAKGSPMQKILGAVVAAISDGYSTKSVKQMIVEYASSRATKENRKVLMERADLIINKAIYQSSQSKNSDKTPQITALLKKESVLELNRE